MRTQGPIFVEKHSGVGAWNRHSIPVTHQQLRHCLRDRETQRSSDLPTVTQAPQKPGNGPRRLALEWLSLPPPPHISRQSCKERFVMTQEAGRRGCPLWRACWDTSSGLVVSLETDAQGLLRSLVASRGPELSLLAPPKAALRRGGGGPERYPDLRTPRRHQGRGTAVRA